ncbi:SPOR domain-containing protein [Methyloversatilis universalis]|uniref:SPOR domain-containing protein n=1 Tax=Methyloversatilis universalis TaxID=378211 RepID=UPI00037C4065|nr:SPOR domain-containing protein [Methyloversatilis universalis]
MAKAPQKKASPRNNRGGTVVGIFIGLVLGVVLSAGVMWYIHGSSLPLQVRENAPAPGHAPAQPAALPGKPGDKAAVPAPAEAKRFDFYDLLPGNAQTPGSDKPAAEAAPAPAPAAAAPAADTPAAKLILQAGAFSSEEEADNLRARLALIGLESGVQKVTVAGKGTLYRVRLGPFASAEDMQRTRAELAQNGIEASVVR